MSNNKQSSVEWFAEQTLNAFITKEKYDDLLEQAKAMHKEEITEAFLDGKLDGWQNQWAHPNDYYNETFNTKEK